MAAVGRRYAQALLELAREAGQVTSVQQELTRFGKIWDESPDLRDAFETPELGPEARRVLVDATSSKANTTAHTTNLLRMLAERHRMECIPSLVSEYVALAEAETGQMRAEVVTAVSLDDAYFNRLQSTLESITGKKITIERKLDPAILGGVIASVGGKVFDGSLRTRLDELRDTLTAE